MQELKSSFISNFIDDNRWRYITDGLKITLLVTVFAVLIGVVLGFLIAIVRTTHDKTGKLKILNAICKVYLTVIRGTPVVVQLMIIYFIIFFCTKVFAHHNSSSNTHACKYPNHTEYQETACSYCSRCFLPYIPSYKD